MNTLTFRITNITCDACVKMCTLLLTELPGVTDVIIDRASGAATVSGEQPLDLEIVRQQLTQHDYTVTADGHEN